MDGEMQVTHSLAVVEEEQCAASVVQSFNSLDYWGGLRFSCPHTCLSDSAPPDLWQSASAHGHVQFCMVRLWMGFLMPCSTLSCCWDLWWPLWKHLDLGRGECVGVKVCESSCPGSSWKDTETERFLNMNMSWWWWCGQDRTALKTRPLCSSCSLILQMILQVNSSSNPDKTWFIAVTVDHNYFLRNKICYYLTIQLLVNTVCYNVNGGSTIHPVSTSTLITHVSTRCKFTQIRPATMSLCQICLIGHKLRGFGCTVRCQCWSVEEWQAALPQHQIVLWSLRHCCQFVVKHKPAIQCHPTWFWAVYKLQVSNLKAKFLPQHSSHYTF